MRLRGVLAGAAVVLCAAAAPAFAAPSIEAHDLTVRLTPAESRLDAVDRITLLRDGGGNLEFTLHQALAIASATLDDQPVEMTRTAADDWAATWTLPVPAGRTDRAVLVLTYSGKIADGIERRDASFVVGDQTRGLIAPEGVFLSGGSLWYPGGDRVAKFTVRTEPVAGWEVVTQGSRAAPEAEGGPTVWTGKYTADGCDLVAGPWKVFRKRFGDVDVGCYLTDANAAGGDALLDQVGRYLAKYGALLGPYAYDRFDIVENFFTTGYGMPEFTLMGGNVIARMLDELKRKGSIPAGYLGHEIVHCWWGNVVFPDYATGNWCEALTTYCANYGEKEDQGPEAAAESRRITSLKFALRVTGANDYPVRAFRGKKEAADDDIGYGKGSMFFHALRREVGEDAFWGTLRRVALERRGQRFGWEDWRLEFEKSSKRKLGEFFEQGLDRMGAPLLELAETRIRTDGGRFRVTGVLRQRLGVGADGLPEKPWRLAVPLVVEHLEGEEETIVDVSGEETPFALTVPSMPQRILADPAHQVFRTLGPEEIPACFAATMARPRVLVVYPDGDDALAAVAQMAARQDGATAVAASAAPKAIARGTSYLLLGDAERNPLLATARERLPRHFVPAAAKPETTMVLASSRSPADANEFVTSAVGAPAALAARARYVFYYQFDGRVVFDGPVPKERTAVPAPSRTTRLLLPDLKAATSPERAQHVVDVLAAPEMKGRLAGSPGDAKARKFVIDELRLAGVEAREEPFSFTVKHVDPAQTVLARIGGAPVEGTLPLVASPETPEGGVSVIGSVTDDDADVAGRALVVDIGAGVETPLEFLRDAAKLAVARKAAALFVRMPAQVGAPIADLWAFPETLHADVAKRLGEALARGGDGDPVRHAAGAAARTGSDVELPLPTIAVPHDFKPVKDEILKLVVRFRKDEIRTANLVGRLKAKGDRRAGAVVLGAHLDHLGEGFPGADDNASGVAALLEAVQVLSAQADLLARDVVVCVFGAEEWGLRGSRAFVDALPANHDVVAMVNADTVGRRGVEGVSVVGITMHPRLGRAVATAIEQSALDAGREIDKFAFAWGSDHWSFHQRGIPAVDLWSGDYKVMHSQGDTADGVDPAKVARIGRVLALSALAVAGGW